MSELHIFSEIHINCLDLISELEERLKAQIYFLNYYVFHRYPPLRYSTIIVRFHFKFLILQTEVHSFFTRL